LGFKKIKIHNGAKTTPFQFIYTFFSASQKHHRKRKGHEPKKNKAAEPKLNFLPTRPLASCLKPKNSKPATLKESPNPEK